MPGPSAVSFALNRKNIMCLGSLAQSASFSTSQSNAALRRPMCFSPFSRAAAVRTPGAVL